MPRSRYLLTTRPGATARGTALCFAFLAVPASARDLAPAWSVASAPVIEARTYTEGPVFGADGSLFVSEPATGTVTRHRANGERETFVERRPGANGHAILEDGTHVVMSRPAILWLSDAGEVLHEISEHDGEPFVFPNDLAPDGAGGFWFTDSGSRTEATGAIYHVDAERTVRRLSSGLAFPNGVIAHGERLYVSQSQANDLLVFDIGANRTIANKRVLARFVGEELDDAKAAPDGMCLGPGGRLWVTHNGTGMIRVLDLSGRPIASYRTDLLTNSNCAFGPDGALYVTGSFGFETDPGGVVRLMPFAIDGPASDERVPPSPTRPTFPSSPPSTLETTR